MTTDDSNAALFSDEPTIQQQLDRKLRDLHIGIGKIQMQNRVFRWALENKSKLDVLDLTASLIRVCEEEVKRAEPPDAEMAQGKGIR